MISKPELHSHCLQLLQEKCHNIQQLIDDARASSNSDTKSSMGDKYETTREMMQIEINKLSLQLTNAQQMLLAIKVLNPNIVCKKVETGALIKTDKATFYLAAGLGKVLFNNEEIMVVSPASPISKQMLNLTEGKEFVVNGVRYFVESIC